MNDNQTLRKLLADQPRLTAEEIGAALGWSDLQVRNVINGLMHRCEGASLPKRYELTPLGERRARQGGRITLTDEERKEKSIQRTVAYRQRQKLKKESEREEKERALVEAERCAAMASNDSMVQKAINGRHPLAMAWGGANVA